MNKTFPLTLALVIASISCAVLPAQTSDGLEAQAIQLFEKRCAKCRQIIVDRRSVSQSLRHAKCSSPARAIDSRKVMRACGSDAGMRALAAQRYGSAHAFVPLAYKELGNGGSLPQDAIPAVLHQRAAAERGSKTNPLVNSLGMKFVPVPGVAVLFSAWETRRGDYAAFAGATPDINNSWRNQNFENIAVSPSDDHPVVAVSWDDAKRFCAWLTEKERKAGQIESQQEYRLPTDLEWSAAAGLSGESGGSPQDRNMEVKDVYPWGTQWPPPQGAGNYDSYSSSRLHTDSFDRTSPVGSFAANAVGLFDVGGNVWEWCEDFYYDDSKGARVLRGASWGNSHPLRLLSSHRYGNRPDFRSSLIGFRIVLGNIRSTTPSD